MPKLLGKPPLALHNDKEIDSNALINSAYGEFECTHDCTDITSASFLSNVGKKSDVLLRISTVGPERGSADTTRDVHGWGMKIYTDEGNQDFVCNNIVRRCSYDAWCRA
jgi:catalase